MTEKKKRPQYVFTLLVEVGRKDGDGLPSEAIGGSLMIYASGVDEAEAVRETVAILKQADLAPLDVTGYGTLDERLSEGHDISQDERDLMQRSLNENSVIVAQMTPFFENTVGFTVGFGLSRALATPRDASRRLATPRDASRRLGR